MARLAGLPASVVARASAVSRTTKAQAVAEGGMATGAGPSKGVNGAAADGTAMEVDGQEGACAAALGTRAFAQPLHAALCRALRLLRSAGGEGAGAQAPAQMAELQKQVSGLLAAA